MTVLCGSCHRIKGFHFLVNESESRLRISVPLRSLKRTSSPWYLINVAQLAYHSPRPTRRTCRSQALLH